MANDFEQNPLFQLNLVLWLAWFSPSATITGIRPIFQEIGFDLHSIEPQISVPLEKYQKVRQSGTNLKQNPEPDVLLRHRIDSFWLPIECKVSSFGSASDTSEQAYSLLANSGADIAQHIGAGENPNWNALLFYAVKEGDERPMFKTLQNLSAKLKSIGIEPIESGAIGIEVTQKGIFLNFEPVNQVSSLIEGASSNKIEIKSGDPNFMYLIPTDLEELQEENGSSEGLKVLHERIRISIATIVVSKLHETNFSVTEDEIMEAAIEVWPIWRKFGAKKALMHQAIRPYLRSIVSEIKDAGINVQIKQRQMEFMNISSLQAKELVNYFTSAAFKNGHIDLVANLRQKSFDDLEGFWPK